MIALHPVSLRNVDDFSGTSYDAMSREEKVTMIEESICGTHTGSFFQLLTVYKDDRIIGFMNLAWYYKGKCSRWNQ